MKLVDKQPPLPVFDDQGRNLVDPADRWGRKTSYITLLQAKALERYAGRGPGFALDLGCGYGRMSGALRGLGWEVVGLDPSHRILSSAKARAPEGKWCVGRLPELPLLYDTFDLVLCQNLLRVLHLNDDLKAADAIPRLIKRGGRLVVVDNMRVGHKDFVSEQWIKDSFEDHGLLLRKRVAIRAARWWGIYFVRYGLIPPFAFEWLVSYELKRMARRKRAPRFQYQNVLFVFERST